MHRAAESRCRQLGRQRRRLRDLCATLEAQDSSRLLNLRRMTAYMSEQVCLDRYCILQAWHSCWALFMDLMTHCLMSKAIQLILPQIRHWLTSLQGNETQSTQESWGNLVSC